MISRSVEEQERLTRSDLQEFLSLGGRFCLSDDSHGLDQVGLNFHRVLEFIERVGIRKLDFLDMSDEGVVMDKRFPQARRLSMGLDEVKQAAFWRES